MLRGCTHISGTGISVSGVSLHWGIILILVVGDNSVMKGY
jgi:hypothetical protein